LPVPVTRIDRSDYNPRRKSDIACYPHFPYGDRQGSKPLVTCSSDTSANGALPETRNLPVW
jgi:hypothetical protein